MKNVRYIFYSIILIFLFACETRSIDTEESTIDTLKVVTPPVIKKDSSRSVFIDRSEEINISDTLYRGSYIVYFQPGETMVDAHYYHDQKKIDSIDKHYDNSHQFAEAIEKYRAKEWSTVFKADDSTITIFLENHKTLVLPKEDKGNEMWLNFNYYFPETHYVLLHVQFVEGSAFMLVDRRTGYRKLIRGRPYFSPDKRSILTTSVDLEAHYSMNGIEYYHIQGDTLAKAFEVEIANWGPSNVKWISNESLQVERWFWTVDKDYKMIYHTEYSEMTITKKK